jgi:hypothetical protein
MWLQVIFTMVPCKVVALAITKMVDWIHVANTWVGTKKILYSDFVRFFFVLKTYDNLELYKNVLITLVYIYNYIYPKLQLFFYMSCTLHHIYMHYAKMQYD